MQKGPAAMSQTPDPSGPDHSRPVSAQGWFEPGPRNIQLIYVLYLAAFVVGLSALVGVVIAYMNRGKAGGYVESHYTWAIRTFWIGLLASFVGLLLMIVGIGFLIFLAVAIWVIIRMIKGLQWLGRGEPVPDPQSWWI